MPKETPLIYSAPMILALLKNLKTKTRRIMNPQPLAGQIIPKNWSKIMVYNPDDPFGDGLGWGALDSRGNFHEFRCPYGQVGDLLWSKEAYHITWFGGIKEVSGEYLADGTKFKKRLTDSEWEKLCARKHPTSPTPGQFMYKSLARIWREITDIGAEPLQDISEEDAKSEGVYFYGWDDPEQTDYRNYLHEPDQCDDWGVLTARGSFKTLWDSINSKKYPWKSNPWIWVITFKEWKP